MQKNIRFSLPDKAKFFQTLRDRVNGYFRDKKISRNGDWRMFLKTFILLGMYIGPFVLIMLNIIPVWAVLLSYFVMGVGLVGIGMSIMHDANHGAYSNTPWVNRMLGLTMNLIGGHALTWKVQHNVMHHTYTNIYGLDEDIEDKPILRLSPDGTLKKIHRYQHLYAPLLYGMATLSWILWKDFLALAAYNKEGKTQDLGHSPVGEFVLLTVTKIAYWCIFFIAPLVFLSYAPGILIAGFFLMHFTAGTIMTMVFQLAHVVENTSHYMPDEEGNVENVWAIHQMATTSNFARKNKLVSWYVGGLNFQVEHHLFPNICHVHYPEVAEIVKATADEFGVPYLEYKTFGQALSSHFKTLKALGRNELSSVVAKAPEEKLAEINN
jgi:linoleoyl-CoA desaturase